MEFSFAELTALVDALKKGAARHESYAKFYKNRQTNFHRGMAAIMRDLKERVQVHAARKGHAA